jgi:CRISPR system Cascade subunit CasC
MTTPRFLQIHTLQSYPAVLLNRDDSGLAKRLPFGGATRTRISSQCLKRHWRTADDEHALASIGLPMGVRSREIVTQEVMEPLLAGADQKRLEIVKAIGEEFQKGVYGDKGTVKKNRQPLLLGWPEVEYLRGLAKELATAADNPKAAAASAAAVFKDKDMKRNLSAMLEAKGTLQAGLEAALFGRMVTSDPAANTDAAMYVGHAFTVHAEESESDYFSVVDDLKEEDDDAGADHIGDVELTSGLFYGYVVVDVPTLVSNLEGCSAEKWLLDGTDRAVCATVVEHLCHLIATVSPGAKLGSTAPFAWARLMLIEAGSRQPRSLANAFRKPVGLNNGLEDEARARLVGELGKLDAAYGAGEARRFMSVEDMALPGAERLSLDALAGWAAGVVRQGQA